MAYELGEWLPLTNYLRLPLNMSGVYIIKNLVNGREYVGKSVNIRARLKDHCEARDKSKYLYRSMAKHGLENFEACVYLEGTEQELSELEVLLIEERNTFSPLGFNMTLGGEGSTGYKFSNESLEKLRQRMLGTTHTEETRALMSKARFSNNHRLGTTLQPSHKATFVAAGLKASTGRVLSEATKVRMSEALKGYPGRPWSEASKEKLRASKLGVPRPDLSERFKGEGNPAFGKAAKSRRAIKVTSTTDSTVLKFDNMLAASVYFGVNQSSIVDWCSGRYKTKKPFKFEYDDQ